MIIRSFLLFSFSYVAVVFFFYIAKTKIFLSFSKKKTFVCAWSGDTAKENEEFEMVNKTNVIKTKCKYFD